MKPKAVPQCFVLIFSTFLISVSVFAEPSAALNEEPSAALNKEPSALISVDASDTPNENTSPAPDENQQDTKSNQGSAESNESGEMLIAQPPKGWQLIYQFNNTETRLSDFIPDNEQETDWRTKLSFESHIQVEEIDPISIIMGEIKSRSEICKGIDHFNLFSGLENNYPTSVRLILCGENAHTGLGEVSLIKAIQGQSHFYLIHLIKKIPVFENDSSQSGKPDFTNEEIAGWSTYMKRISLCNKQDDRHPCPTLNPASN